MLRNKVHQTFNDGKPLEKHSKRDAKLIYSVKKVKSSI